MPTRPPTERHRSVVVWAAAAGLIGVAVIGVIVTASGSGDELAAAATTAAPAAATVDKFSFDFNDTSDLAIADPTQNADEPATELEQLRDDGGCTIGALSLRLGASGDGVACLQDALQAVGFLDGAITGEFGDSTLSAVMSYQTAEDLYVDGVIGRESSLALGIWPDEESLVVRTPPPAAGATDLWGVTLSPVASTGADAPPLPENSGSGRRVVYDRAGQRTWAVSDSGEIIRSWLVAGSQYSNEVPGTHEVYSRSEMSTAWNGKAWLPQMIRWLKTERGAIGFHAIPLHVSDDSPYMTTDELGTRLSGGCQRQHNLDSEFMWAFATIGTPVIVT
jgi:peptidoglycan hydrolase-like protein with peptidoglycan-binding domain